MASAGMSVLKHPMVLIGHEFVGVISKVPAGSDLKVGQTVAVNRPAPAISARYCLSLHQNLCGSMRFMGGAQFNPRM